jgi:hypothetical protein
LLTKQQRNWNANAVLIGADLLPLNRSRSNVRIWAKQGRRKWQGSVFFPAERLLNIHIESVCDRTHHNEEIRELVSRLGNFGLRINAHFLLLADRLEELAHFFAEEETFLENVLIGKATLVL